MRKINSIWFGPRVLLIGLVALAVGGAATALRSVSRVLLVAGLAFLATSAAIFVSMVIVLIFEAAQDRRAWRSGLERRAVPRRLSETDFECQRCGSRRVTVFDRNCPVCGAGLLGGGT